MELYASNCFTLGERAPDSNWVRGWAKLRTGINMAVKSRILALAGSRTAVVQLML
jgi:hypothetical protein